MKKQMPHPRLFDAAVEEARAYWRIRAGAKGAAAAAAAAQVAATNAANVNNMPRCRKCEACVNLLSSGRRRCLLVRAFAAAAAGHTGAQLAILGTKAVGARVQVWWPLDEDWYPGVVTGCACPVRYPACMQCMHMRFPSLTHTHGYTYIHTIAVSNARAMVETLLRAAATDSDARLAMSRVQRAQRSRERGGYFHTISIYV